LQEVSNVSFLLNQRFTASIPGGLPGSRFKPPNHSVSISSWGRDIDDDMVDENRFRVKMGKRTVERRRRVRSI
jgi:hypothetical protein